MDVFNDFLAIGNYISDSTLSGLSAAQTNQMPYIAILSISENSKIYWAKGFPEKLQSLIGAIKFSSDGQLLIAHSSGVPSAISDDFIVVMNVDSGKVLSARKYSTGTKDSYNSNVKSILLSSGSLPMAYVLSNNKGPPYTQRLF